MVIGILGSVTVLRRVAKARKSKGIVPHRCINSYYYVIICNHYIHSRSIPLFTMSGPFFFQQPLRYLRWASHEKPAIFYSFVVGLCGPVSFFVAPPLRRFFNDGPRETIPLTYPSTLILLRDSKGTGAITKAPLVMITDNANVGCACSTVWIEEDT